jgi:integrase
VKNMTPGTPPAPHPAGGFAPNPADPSAPGGVEPGAQLPAPSGDVRAAGDRSAADPLQALARRAAQIRRDHPPSDGRPADWADPDPQALLALPASQHPVRRALDRSKEGKARADFGSLLRRSYEMIAGLEPGSTSGAAVYSYPWHLLDEEGAEEFRRTVYRRYPIQSTRNDYICAVRRVVDECHRKRLISPLRRQILFEALYTLAPGRSRRRRRLSHDETRALLLAGQAHPVPARAARDTAMVAVIRSTGMRGCELAGIDLGDWDRADASIWLRDRKNGRDLLVFLPPVVLPYLDRWLLLRGDEPGPLFRRLDGQDINRPLTAFGIRCILKTVATSAGVTWMGSHDYRRTFATEMLERHDPVLVSDLLGHEKVDSTRTYDQRGDDALRAAVAEVPLPELGSLLRQAAETGPRPGQEAAA